MDDPMLMNPLQRLERLGTGWFGVVFEFEGVLVEDMYRDHIKARRRCGGDLAFSRRRLLKRPLRNRQAWELLADREQLRKPLQHQLTKAAGMKPEQAIAEVFLWARAPLEVKRLAGLKEEIFAQVTESRVPKELEGIRPLLDTLKQHGIPMAVATTASRRRLEDALQAHGLREYFAAFVCGEDVQRGRPDPEAYLVASMDLQRPPMRCVAIGNHNQVIEAATEARPPSGTTACELLALVSLL